MNQLLGTIPWHSILSQNNSVLKICPWTETPPKMSQNCRPSPAEVPVSMNEGAFQSCPECEMPGIYLKQWGGMVISCLVLKHTSQLKFIESWCFPAEAFEVLGEGSLFYCMVPVNMVLFTGTGVFYALQQLLLNQKEELVRVNRKKNLDITSWTQNSACVTFLRVLLGV